MTTEPNKHPQQHCGQPPTHPGHRFMRGRAVHQCPGVGYAGPYDLVWTRLCEIRNLRDGWLDGEGKAVHEDVVQIAGKIAEALPANLRPISIYPTGPGGIELEWRDAHGTHSITVNPDLTLLLMSDEPVPAPTVAGAEAMLRRRADEAGSPS